MKQLNFFRTRGGKRYLRDYIRLVIGFYGCLLVLALYQQMRLYGQGVLDAVFSVNFLLLLVHHLGFAALAGLVWSSVFNGIERWKPGWGFRSSLLIFFLLLLNELVLIEYFIEHYTLPGAALRSAYQGVGNTSQLVVFLVVGGVVLATAFRFFYRISKRSYRIIARMYPTTIVLISIFLATLFSEKKPVNLNKNQDVITSLYQKWTERTPYEGTSTYPLWVDWEYNDALGPHLDWPEDPVNVVVIAVDGLNGAFVGDRAPYRAFMPHLDSLRKASLYWPEFLANAQDPEEAFPLIAGSLPRGLEGFTDAPQLPNRFTLFSLLKQNGYRTSFQFGGNAALPKWDRLLYAERVDEIVDQKSFGQNFAMQPRDAAGISIGYPDGAVFERYLVTRVNSGKPFFDYFQTLSSRPPFSYPGNEQYLRRADSLIEGMSLAPRERRVLIKNKEFAAALHYTDRVLQEFIDEFQKREVYSRTLFVITGTHHPRKLATRGKLQSRQVPLLVFSPMLKSPQTMKGPAFQADIAPGLLGSLARRYNLVLPDKAAWIGSGFKTNLTDSTAAAIPIYRRKGEGAAWIHGGAFVDGEEVYEIGPGLELEKIQKSSPRRENLLDRSLKWEAADRYVVRENTLIPAEAAPYENLIPAPSDRDLVWIHSVFNGKDFDLAYTKARQLALDGERDRAKLLCRYILSKVPGHVDTEILLGRTYAWERNYEQAANILEQVVQKHPVYEDGYAALLDVYYWSGNRQGAQYLKPAIGQHLNPSARIQHKMERAGIAKDPEGSALDSADRQLSQALLK